MEPGQQSSSPPKHRPFSNEETQLFFNIRDSMDQTFRLASALGKAGLWQEISRRLGEFGHHRSPQELETQFGDYKPKRPTRKKRKRAVSVANEQQQQDAQCSGAAAPPQDHQDQLARSRGVEAARKKLLEAIDLDDFFSHDEKSWKDAIASMRLARSESELEESH